MYDFIFIFWYQLNEKLRSNDSIFYAKAFLTLAIIFHFLLVGATIKYLGLFQSLFNQPFDNKYYYLPFALLLVYGIERLYQSRVDRVIEKYKGRQVSNWTNAIIVLSLTFLPLAISIKLLTK